MTNTVLRSYSVRDVSAVVAYLLGSALVVFLLGWLATPVPVDSPAEDVSSPVWTCLVDHGLVGTSLDGVERLYPRRGVLWTCGG